ncbi:MAG TPA: 50S ribosomal protein L18 [Aggregatilinea sp.]|jgi:large subunit ribosomal protein L18|uniref:50S ribosomal protein L18 n=1 Tax=Aggregatilinea sp. TaxID=2806333 RepID=UPI002CA5AE7A|nr:50S ribosomal protein L18 [Aggregatilinea sp.]HML22139.1 50S ribosomal protein L18 [Aggregatilinea sp.]
MGEKERIARKRRQRRVRAKISGTPARPRLNVFRSLGNIYAQVIDDTAGFTLASASTVDRELRDQVEGKSKTEAAKLVGELVAKRAQSAGVTQVVFDRGGYRFHGRVKALADGAREAGLQF